MKWPPRSPDLNIIEFLCGYLEKRRAEKQVLQDAWNNIPMDYIIKL